MSMRFKRLLLAAGGGGGGSSSILTVQNWRTTNNVTPYITQPGINRLRPREQVRAVLIVRNLGVNDDGTANTNIGEIGFVAANNSNVTAPGSWSDVLAGEEWYDLSGLNTDQVWIRSKTSGQLVMWQIETLVNK